MGDGGGGGSIMAASVCYSITAHLLPQGGPGLFAGQMSAELIFKPLTTGQIKATAAIIHPGGQEMSPGQITIYNAIPFLFNLITVAPFYHLFINVHYTLPVHLFLVKYY